MSGRRRSFAPRRETEQNRCAVRRFVSVLLWASLGCASVGEPRKAPQNAQREPPTSAKLSAEAALGVADRGIFADLDVRVQLPAPPERARLTALVDRRRSLLVVYADGWPHKVYPLGGPATLVVGGELLALRPGDRAELAG